MQSWFSVDIRTVLDQFFDDIAPPPEKRRLQSCTAYVAGFHIRTGFCEEANHFWVLLSRRLQKGCNAVRIAGVHVRAVPNEGRHYFTVAAPCCQVQRKVPIVAGWRIVWGAVIQ